MKEFFPRSEALAAELHQALAAFPHQLFAPNELLAELRTRSVWSEYLAQFESERGQSAALGRFLVELGLSKAEHHRTRGSLYARQAAVDRLAALSASPAPPSPPPPPPSSGDAAPRRRHSEISTGPWTSASGASAGAAAAPSRSVPVIGWRRRASDASGAGPPTRPEPPMAAAGPPASAQPPVWVGGGSAAGPPPVPAAPWHQTPLEAPAQAPAEAGLPLAFYWTQVRRYFFRILLASVLGTVVVAFYTLRIPKQYESVATLRMDFKSPLVQADATNNPAFDPTMLIQTEVSDITQRSVVLDAIHAAHLDQNPALLRQIAGAKAETPSTADPDARQTGLIDLIQAQAAAIQPDNTHNIEIHYKALDPDTAATVANALGAALIAHEFQTRQKEQDQQLGFMQQQFADINTRLEKEQAALTQYQLKNNILNPDSQSSLENSTLNTLNTSFLQAQDAATKYQAEMGLLQSGQLTDALLASEDGQALRPAYDAWRAAQARMDQVKAARGPQNPEYKAASDGLAAADAQMQSVIASVKNQIASQYQQAQDRADLVGKQLGQARDAMQHLNQDLIPYNTQKRDLDADQKLHDDLEAQIKQQQLLASVSTSGLRVTDPATPDPAPVYPNVRENVVLALLFSLLGGCGVAVLAGYLDRSFTAPDGIEQYLRIPLLGALPVIASKASLIELADSPASEGDAIARSAFAEAVLMLRTAVLYAAPHGARVFSVTSAEPQEGKSVVTANLAIALALHGAKVLLVDGDIRRPFQHRIFEVPNSSGLSSLMRQSVALEECFRPTRVEGLYLMPAGPAVSNPGELVATMLGPVLQPLAAEFDYLIVDSPPLLGFADAVSIATAVEGTLLVARAGKTPREIVLASLQPLQRVRARVLGLVLNQVSRSLSPYYSYYRDHYSRYYSDRDGDSRDRQGKELRP